LACLVIDPMTSREDLSKLFVTARGLGASSFSGSLVGIEGSQSLRRASSIRRTFTAGTAAIKRKSICLQVLFYFTCIKSCIYYVCSWLHNHLVNIIHGKILSLKKYMKVISTFECVNTNIYWVFKNDLHLF
jgi:hypothetical protein